MIFAITYRSSAHVIIFVTVQYSKGYNALASVIIKSLKFGLLILTDVK